MKMSDLFNNQTEIRFTVDSDGRIIGYTDTKTADEHFYRMQHHVAYGIAIGTEEHESPFITLNKEDANNLYDILASILDKEDKSAEEVFGDKGISYERLCDRINGRLYHDEEFVPYYRNTPVTTEALANKQTLASIKSNKNVCGDIVAFGGSLLTTEPSEMLTLTLAVTSNNSGIKNNTVEVSTNDSKIMTFIMDNIKLGNSIELSIDVNEAGNLIISKIESYSRKSIFPVFICPKCKTFSFGMMGRLGDAHDDGIGLVCNKCQSYMETFVVSR